MIDDIYVGYWQSLRDAGQLDRKESKLAFLSAWRMYVHQQTRYAVDNERFLKKSWQEIGDTLCITKQAAQQKYGKKEPKTTFVDANQTSIEL